MDEKIIEIARRYAEEVRRRIPARMVVLYGSYAKSRPNSASDIDIAVIVDKAPRDYLQASTNLFNLVRNIDKRIEPVLVVRKNDKSGFLDSILKYGSIIYEAKY